MVCVELRAFSFGRSFAEHVETDFSSSDDQCAYLEVEWGRGCVFRRESVYEVLEVEWFVAVLVEICFRTDELCCANAYLLPEERCDVYLCCNA